MIKEYKLRTIEQKQFQRRVPNMNTQYKNLNEVEMNKRMKRESKRQRKDGIDGQTYLSFGSDFLGEKKYQIAAPAAQIKNPIPSFRPT